MTFFCQTYKKLQEYKKSILTLSSLFSPSQLILPPSLPYLPVIYYSIYTQSTIFIYIFF